MQKTNGNINLYLTIFAFALHIFRFGLKPFVSSVGYTPKNRVFLLEKVAFSYGFLRNSLIPDFVSLEFVVTRLNISVRFFTSLREIVGKKEETLEFDAGDKVTVNKVLEKLSKLHGKSFAQYVYDSKSGGVKDFLQFFVNGRSAMTLDGFETQLADGDVLAIIPPVGGG